MTFRPATVLVLAAASIALSSLGCEGQRCPKGLGECGGYCLDLASNVTSCGACGNACGTDQACIEGECVALCEEVSFSTHGELAALLADLSWVSHSGVMRYAVSSADVAIESSDVGDGYIFLSTMSGVDLSSEVTYGFDGSLEESTGCGLAPFPMYPSVGYASMSIQSGLSFAPVLTTYAADAIDWRCSDESYCVALPIPPVFPMECCCSVSPFLWNILGVVSAPFVCTAGTSACDTEFAHTDHSLCYPDYETYMARALDLHHDCVEPDHGYLRAGHACSCEVLCGDVWETRESTCNGEGRCDTGLASFGGMCHQWGQDGCL